MLVYANGRIKDAGGAGTRDVAVGLLAGWGGGWGGLNTFARWGGVSNLFVLESVHVSGCLAVSCCMWRTRSWPVLAMYVDLCTGYARASSHALTCPQFWLECVALLALVR